MSDSTPPPQHVYDSNSFARIIDEKEKDLALAAKIGQSLLARNKDLQEQNEYLEEQVTSANDQLTQLRHELQMRSDLFRLYAADADSDVTQADGASPEAVNWYTLQKKLKNLDEENAFLKFDLNKLRHMTSGLEEREQQLLSDALKQLADAQSNIDSLDTELDDRTLECAKVNNEVTKLLSQLVAQQSSVKTLTVHNEELHDHVVDLEEKLNELSEEQIELQIRYAEVLAMLHEAKNELNELRDREKMWDTGYESLQSEFDALESHRSTSYIAAERQNYQPKPPVEKVDASTSVTTSIICDSVAELAAASQQPPSAEDAVQRVSNQLSRILMTARKPLKRDKEGVVERRLHWNSPRHTPPPVSKQAEMTVETVQLTEAEAAKVGHPCSLNLSRAVPNFPEPHLGLGSPNSSDSSTGCNCTDGDLGVPGIPGSKDLENALKRLNLRRQVEKEYRDRYNTAIASIRSKHSTSASVGNVYSPRGMDSTQIPCRSMGIPSGDDDAKYSARSITPRTPRLSKLFSISSVALNALSSGCERDKEAGYQYLLSRANSMANQEGITPEKARLEIVKNISGSVTLQQWQALANSTLTESLDPLPGVFVRPSEMPISGSLYNPNKNGASNLSAVRLTPGMTAPLTPSPIVSPFVTAMTANPTSPVTQESILSLSAASFHQQHSTPRDTEVWLESQTENCNLSPSPIRRSMLKNDVENANFLTPGMDPDARLEGGVRPPTFMQATDNCANFNSESKLDFANSRESLQGEELPRSAVSMAGGLEYLLLNSPPPSEDGSRKTNLLRQGIVTRSALCKTDSATKSSNSGGSSV